MAIGRGEKCQQIGALKKKGMRGKSAQPLQEVLQGEQEQCPTLVRVAKALHSPKQSGAKEAESLSQLQHPKFSGFTYL